MNEITSTQMPWISEGYRVFAHEGPVGLKVERLARSVNKNKSSFYHHFADLEVFTNFLLKYHLLRADIIAEKESQCTNVEELIEVLVAHKLDLLFNRQLRIHRQNKDFANCFEETNQHVANAILGVWANMLGLTENSYLAALVLKLSMENFYLQITEETLNPTWLSGYFKQLQEMVKEFKKMGDFVPFHNG
ncbi:TetR family transcriptional regulator [marine bacterium AO1-C]|nr:TetR family transcriptional regulator [marine bacterium AO1-C]